MSSPETEARQNNLGDRVADHGRESYVDKKGQVNDSSTTAELSAVRGVCGRGHVCAALYILIFFARVQAILRSPSLPSSASVWPPRYWHFCQFLPLPRQRTFIPNHEWALGAP